eukprot:6644748-Lingulodinium_polyedra.AAC.1
MARMAPSPTSMPGCSSRESAMRPAVRGLQAPRQASPATSASPERHAARTAAPRYWQQQCSKRR